MDKKHKKDKEKKKSRKEGKKLPKAAEHDDAEEGAETVNQSEAEMQVWQSKGEEEEGVQREEDTEREGLVAGWKRKKKRGPRKNRHSELDPQTLGYFQRVDTILQQGFSSEEERTLFVTNVFAEVNGKEFSLSTDQMGSLVLEKLLPCTTASQLHRFLSALGTHFGESSCHRCGAHVLEAALLQIPRFQQHLQEAMEVEDEESRNEEVGDAGTLEGVVLQLCEGVKARLLDFSQDSHASFVIRTLIQILGGVMLNTGGRGNKMQDSSHSNRKQAVNPSQVTEFEPPPSFLEELHVLSSCLQENIQVFVTGGVASHVFQVTLQVLQRRLPDACNELCKAIISYLTSRNPSADSSPLLMFLKDQTTSHLLERVLEVSNKKLFKKLYKSHLKGHLISLSLHEVANFSVQRVILAVPSAKLFARLFDELCPGLEGILAKGHMGVITQLTAACGKHKTQQEQLLDKLMEAFHCAEPPSRQINCAPLFLSLLAYEVYYELSDEDSAREHQPSDAKNLKQVNYHGSLLVQYLLQFEDPSPLFLSLMAMSEDDIVTLACDPAGSHVLDVLVSSNCVPEKRRKKILGKLKGHYVKLACNKHGSRVLDRIWKSTTLCKKQIIAEELVAKEEVLRRDNFGHHIIRNFALVHFLKRRREWEEHQAAESKRRKMFSEILED